MTWINNTVCGLFFLQHVFEMMFSKLRIKIANKLVHVSYIVKFPLLLLDF
jgi:hypothetical protein